VSEAADQLDPQDDQDEQTDTAGQPRRRAGMAYIDALAAWQAEELRTATTARQRAQEALIALAVQHGELTVTYDQLAATKGARLALDVPVVGVLRIRAEDAAGNHLTAKQRATPLRAGG
jgi:hypothetical protein